MILDGLKNHLTLNGDEGFEKRNHSGKLNHRYEKIKNENGEKKKKKGH